MARISYIGDSGEALEVLVGPENPDIMVGRHRTCAIRTANQSVSRQHARVFFDGESYWLQDNGSSNGTFYQNERLEPQAPVQIDNGEFLMCGNFEMRFDLDDEDLDRVEGGGYDDGYAEEAAESVDPEATAFADSAEEWYPEPAAPPPPPPPAPPPPPPPPAAPPMPPAASRASAPVAPPPPLPRRDLPEGGDAHLIEELRSSLAQKHREVEDRDARIQGLRIELESLGRRMDESGNEQRWAELQAELNDLRPLTEQVQALDGEAAELREENDRLRAELQETAVELANARQQGPGSRAEDESHIATLDSEIAMVRESLTAAQEKFEEARAGRRNAEELASLQKMRAESFEAQIGLLKADVERWKAQAAESTGDQISADEFDAQVAARDEAEEKARALQAELTLLRNQLTKAQADLFVASQAAAAQAATVADLTAKVAATPQTGALEARVKELEQHLAARDGELAVLRAQPVGGGDDAALAGLKAELEAVQAKATVAAGESTRVQSELATVSAGRAQLEATVADLQAQLAGASQNAEATQAAEVELERMREQTARLTTANRELEGSASANLKRIQKLMRDIDEARTSAAAGGAVEPLKAQIQQLEGEVAAAKAAQARAEALVTAAAERAPATGGGDHGALTGLLDELNGVVSNFRSDFMAVSDAFEQVRSEDLDERKEGFEQLEESLGACTARSGEIKNLVRDLRARVGVSDE